MVLLSLWLAAPLSVRAQGAFVTLEVSGAKALTAPQRQEYGLGGAAALALLFPVVPQIAAGIRARGLTLTDAGSTAQTGRMEYGRGTLYLGELVLRLRPFGGGNDRKSGGMFLEGAFGTGVTGRLLRSTYGVGLGWAFPVGNFTVAPGVRYLQIIQRRDALSDEDARLGLVGIEVAFGDPSPPPPPVQSAKVAPRVSPEVSPAASSAVDMIDQDSDGVADADDPCPAEAEDSDGFEDEDGCPELDNDGDGVADAQDLCANEAEDLDGIEDLDGCPEEDPDGDGDGIADALDLCPTLPEVVNGNDDEDGCPDEGLVELKDDRIVLDGTVLFDMERVRIRSAAQPVLRAIVKLHSQHPEWQKIHVEGHADARGKESYNQRLSERRARQVRTALIRLGIDEAVIESHGYGSSRLRDPRNTDEAHRRNRRVEFVVLPEEVAEAQVQEEVVESASGEESSPAAELGPSASLQGAMP